MNAVAREVFDAVSSWPRSLPQPQIDSVQINWALPTDDIGTLAGPTRFRRAHPNASPSYEFEIWLSDFECEQFEAWFNDVVARGGEIYLPWIGDARILYISEYELTPYANGWKLHALAVQLYVDPDYCLRHVCDAANAWRAPVIVDADATYPVILCVLPAERLRPRFTDSFFSLEPIARLTARYGPDAILAADYSSSDRFIADLAAATVWGWAAIDWLTVVDVIVADLNAPAVWNGHTLSWFAELTDTITCDLSSTNVLVNVPANWQWDDQIADWEARHRIVYIDDWQTLAWDEIVCRLLKDRLPPPEPIVSGNDWSVSRIIANNFPLEVYRAC